MTADDFAGVGPELGEIVRWFIGSASVWVDNESHIFKLDRRAAVNSGIHTR
jgi:hypothetical protein